MVFGKKLNLYFKNLENIDIECINNIKSIILKDQSVGQGQVCDYSGGNKLINNLDDVPNINKEFQFVLISDSNDNLNQLESYIEND